MIIYLNKRELLLLLVVPILFACIGERCSSCNGESSYVEQYKVSFWGNYAVTKSASALPAGVESSVFTYYCGENPATKKEHPATPFTVVSNLSGNLITANDFTLYLAAGYYDFYAISANSSSLNGLEFKMGQSNPLKNGVDYLWAQSRDITICSHSNIQFNFIHAATSIVIEVSLLIDSLADLRYVELSRVLIGVPDTVQTLNLANGKITLSSSITAPKEEMKIDSNRASYILLPLQKERAIPIELHITTISNTNEKLQEKYYFSLPSPANGFEGGTQYKYRVKISSSKIVFESTSVEPWYKQELDNISLGEKS